MQTAEIIYRNNIKKYREKSDSLKVKINTISIVRLITVIACLVANYILYNSIFIFYILS